jgi:hypothetical protein
MPIRHQRPHHCAPDSARRAQHQHPPRFAAHARALSPVSRWSALTSITQSARAGISATQMSKANNPLADLNGFNFHNYYMPSLFGVPDSVANTMYLRPVMVTGRQIIRGTLPVATASAGGGEYRSGLGDFSIFDAIKLTPEGAATDFAVGPLLVVPTATNSALGQGKWQAGAAAVAIHPMPGGSLMGALVTWQHSFAGDKDRPPAHLMTMQPIGTFSVGGGYYVRSTAVMVFDFENDRYLIPFGLGFGKVFKLGNAVANAFVEPQFAVYHKGTGQPSLQLFMGLNLQWARK